MLSLVMWVSPRTLKILRLRRLSRTPRQQLAYALGWASSIERPGRRSPGLRDVRCDCLTTGITSSARAGASVFRGTSFLYATSGSKHTPLLSDMKHPCQRLGRKTSWAGSHHSAKSARCFRLQGSSATRGRADASVANSRDQNRDTCAGLRALGGAGTFSALITANDPRYRSDAFTFS